MIQVIHLVARILDEGGASACYVRYSASFAPLLPYLRKRLGGKRLVIEVNSLGSRRFRILRAIDSRALRSADLLVAVSESVAAEVRSLVPAAGPRVIVIPNGVDVDRFVLPHRPAAQSGPQLAVGYVGVLKYRYGIEDLISAMEIVWKDYPNAQLKIVGDGPLRDWLAERAEVSTNLHLVGPVPFDDVPNVLHSLDILVCTQSSENRHVSPIKLFEYLAAGRPVIAASVPQVAQLARESEAFLTYRCGNAPDLARQIVRLMKSKTERDCLAARAVPEARRHSWGVRVAAVQSALQVLG